METEKCPFIGVDCEYIPLARKSDAQTKEIERLRKALQFYADPKTWESEWDSQFKTRVPNHDSGLTARVALKEKSDGYR